jgi:hypothetical protein
MKTTLNALAIALTVATRLVSVQAQATEFFSASVSFQSIINNSGHLPTSGLYSVARRLQAASVRGGGAATTCASVSSHRR